MHRSVKRESVARGTDEGPRGAALRVPGARVRARRGHATGHTARCAHVSNIILEPSS